MSDTAAARLTVAAYLRDWLAHCRNRVRTVTYEGYDTMLERHAIPALGGLSLDQVTPLTIQTLYNNLLTPRGERPGLATGTVLNLHLVLNQAFAQAVRWQLLTINPVAGAQPPRPRRSPRHQVDQPLLKQLLDAVAGTWLELPAAIAAATGMRRGEILALRWNDLDPDLSVIRVLRTLQPTREGLTYEPPKTARSKRNITLPAFLTPYLERQRQDQQQRLADDWSADTHVIDRGDGQPRNPDSLSSGWSRTLRNKGLPQIRFHDLRHAHATLMLVQGVHPKIVSERLGHASIGITLDTYSHVLPSLQHQAAHAFDTLFGTTPPPSD
jgi:integrase